MYRSPRPTLSRSHAFPGLRSHALTLSPAYALTLSRFPRPTLYRSHAFPGLRSHAHSRTLTHTHAHSRTLTHPEPRTLEPDP